MFLSPGEMWNESKTLSQGTQIDILTLPYQLCDLRPLLNLLRYQCSAHLWIEDNNIKIKVLNENIQHTASNRDPHRAHVKPVARSELATKTTLLHPSTCIITEEDRSPETSPSPPNSCSHHHCFDNYLMVVVFLLLSPLTSAIHRTSHTPSHFPHFSPSLPPVLKPIHWAFWNSYLSFSKSLCSSLQWISCITNNSKN